MTYASTIAQQAAKHFWRMQETSGTTIADTGTSGAATLTQGTATKNEPGAYTGTTSHFFDAAADAHIGAVSISSASYSVSLLIKLQTPFPTTFHMCAFAMWQTTQTGERMRVYSRRNATNNRFSYNDNTNSFKESSATLTGTPDWHHLTMSLSGTTLKLYLDGTNVSTQTITAPGDSYTGANIGAANTTADPTKGWIQEVAVWDRILTDAEVTAQYQAFLGNADPIANAGADQTGKNGGDTVTLNGSGSTDSDGTIASYAWTQTAGTAVTLSNPAVASPTFTAPGVGSTETLTFQLVVTDNDSAVSAPDTVNIQVLAGTPSPVDGTMSASASIVTELPGPLHPAVHNPAVTIYQSHRGGADILPSETMAAYSASVNNRFSLEGDVYMLQNSGADSDESRMALSHDSDLVAAGYVQSDGVTPVPAGTATNTTSITTFETFKFPHPLGGTAGDATRWKTLAEFLVSNTGGGNWPKGRMTGLESKSSPSLQPIIDSVIARGLQHHVLGNSFDYTRCQAMAAAGMHVMWITTSFATNSAAAVKASGIEWVGWQAGTTGFAAFLAAAHAAGLYVGVYDVQTSSQRDTYTSQGVEMISTDRPDLVYPTTAWSSTAAVVGTSAITADGVRAAATGSTLPETASITSSGTRGAVAASSITATASITAAGIVSTARGAIVSETATVTATGTLGVSAGSTLAETAAVTATGVRGQSVGATVAGTAAISADGSASGVASGSTSVPAVVTITAAGVVSKSGGASLAETGTITSAGLLAKSSSTSLAETGTVTSVGAIGKTVGADVTETAAITTGGVLGRINPADLAALATLTADGLLAKTSGAVVTASAVIEADGVVLTPGEVSGRITRARLRIPATRGRLHTLTARGELQ